MIHTAQTERKPDIYNFRFKKTISLLHFLKPLRHGNIKKLCLHIYGQMSSHTEHQLPLQV